MAVRLAYVPVVATATLRGLDASPDTAAAAARLWRALHPMLRAADAVDAVRNVALFAGFGAVWLASSATRRLRRAVLRATAAGVLLSAAVEVAQLFSPRRFASVLDVLTNGFGAWLGASLVASAIATLARASRPVPLAPAPLAAVALPYALACAVEAVAPLGRPIRVPGAAGGPAARWAAAVAEYRRDPWALPALSDVLLFAPAGALLALWLVERGQRPGRAAAAAAAGAAPVWALALATRGLVGGDLRPLAAVVHTAAAAAGALAAALIVGRAAARGNQAGAQAALARWGGPALAALALMWSLRPFRAEPSLGAVAAKLRGVTWRPLEALFANADVSGVADVAIDFLLYAPLGAWLAARARTAAADGCRARGVWPGLALAVGSEAMQAGVAGRTVDPTEVLVQGGGVLVGWAVLRNAARRRAGRLSRARAASPSPPLPWRGAPSAPSPSGSRPSPA